MEPLLAMIALNKGERAALVLVGAFVVIELLYRVLGAVARRRTPESARRLPGLILRHTKYAAEGLAVSIAGLGVVRLASPSMRPDFSELDHVALILSITAIAVGSTTIASALLVRRWDTTIADNRVARRAVTQLGLVRRVLGVVIVTIGVLAAVTSLPEVRTIGASLLASAGVLGIVAGIAGQSTLGNVIAGLQVTFSDALRLDDVVVVQGEWGRIEQISLTYVVVMIWDERRLVLPVSYFVTTPFENWTRTSAQILGSVHIYLDYTVPIDELRAEIKRFLETQLLWDRRVFTLQVVEVTEMTMQIRVLVSAATSGASWDLRCAVREHVITYVRDHHPDALPRLRLHDSPPCADTLDDDERQGESTALSSATSTERL